MNGSFGGRLRLIRCKGQISDSAVSNAATCIKVSLEMSLANELDVGTVKRMTLLVFSYKLGRNLRIRVSVTNVQPTTPRPQVAGSAGIALSRPTQPPPPILLMSPCAPVALAVPSHIPSTSPIIVASH